MWFLTNWVNEPFAYIDNAFSDQECDDIIKLGTEVFEKTRAVTFGSEKQNEEERNKVRRSDITWLNYRSVDCDWLYRKCTDLIYTINDKFFQFELIALEELQFTHYYDTDGEGGMYDKHADYGYNSAISRKLSFSVQLCDDTDYEGCDLDIMLSTDSYIKSTRNKGAMIVFPSFVMHQANPIIKGERHSLVGWVCGPNFR